MSAQLYASVVMYHFWIGAAVSFCVAVAAYLAAGYMLTVTWKRIARAYSFAVIYYWLKRLEDEGTHCFEKAAKGVES